MYGLRMSAVFSISTTRRIYQHITRRTSAFLAHTRLNEETNVDRPEAGAVAGSHVLVERLDGVRTAELTELLVHVVRSGTRVVTEPDAEVLDLQGLLLVDL